MMGYIGDKGFRSVSIWGLVNMGSVNGFFFQKLVPFGGSFWVYVSALFLPMIGLISKFLFRVQGDESFEKNNSDCLAVSLQKSKQVDSSAMRAEAEFDEQKHDSIEFKNTMDDEEETPETPKFFFKFKFQTYEEFSKSNKKNWDVLPSTSTSKYEFKSDKYLSAFIEEPRDVSFTVEESYADSKVGSFADKRIGKFLSEEDFKLQNSGEETVNEEEAETSTGNACKGVTEKPEVTIFSEESKQLVGEVKNEQNCDGGSGDVKFLSEKDFVALDSDSDSITSSNEFSFMSQFIGSTSEGLFSDGDFEEAFELRNEADDFVDEDSDIMEELEELEDSNVHVSSAQGSEMLSENDFRDNKDSKAEAFGGKDNEPTSKSNVSSDSNMQNPSASLDSEDSNGLETLWEHQDLIEQLKMELKKVRAIGLPTILEESESPKMMEDLKPWKIDEKFQHEDTMGELHKFYKSYRERMRKFDILNYQKMYAIGFLQSKDPLQAISGLKSSPPQMTSLLSQNFLMGKRKKSEFDPMKKFIKELHSDLEVVYVGQVCLSWEILHWQYQKVLELWESDPYGIHRYHEVSGEFQQFQVLLQRFIENEPFEGPRVQNYIKNRCFLRNLLQVPVIREDGIKDKKARMKGKDDYAITSDVLVEIMEESIRIFWRFVRADKDSNIVIQKGRKGTQIEPQDASDLELLSEVRTSLQKKEKKLKEILRRGNCILRKFQKHQDDASDQVLYFFSQVDMKLVARVLNMSKVTTDQLLWCRNKLHKINFVSRKIHVEPSFFLFPC